MKYTNPYKWKDNVFNIYDIDQKDYKESESGLKFNSSIELTGKKSNLFIGLMESDKLSGIAISVDTKTGEIEDVINGQGIVGYVMNVPLTKNKKIELGIEIEKYGNVMLPIISINNEKILHPALYIDNKSDLKGYIGNLSGDSQKLLSNESNAHFVT